VFLCSSTTIIGYFSLMTSNNMALVSYGKLAIAGEVGCLLAAELILPALLLKLRA
jgi:predicted RND superfamily exporter protein